MVSSSQRSSGLFWRTFGMMMLLIFTSLGAWFYCLSLLDEEPRAKAISQQITSVASLTRYALVSADTSYRLDLIMALAQREGLVILPKESSDNVQPIPEDRLNDMVLSFVKDSMGEGTQMALRVNGMKGLWVSFHIEGDEYWLRIERDPHGPRLGTNWILWFSSMLLISMIFTVLLTRRIIEPLARLSEAAKKLGQGEYPDPLPVDGPAEIQQVNDSFNTMVTDMKRLASDRELLLAGISHDLRTPITRLRLEVEMATVPDETRSAMVSDLDQMEGIVKQFMAYVKQGEQPLEVVNLSNAVASAISASRVETDASVQLDVSIDPGLEIRANPTDLSRAIQNLIVNAKKYGRSSDGKLTLSISVKHLKKRNQAVVVVSDEGHGLPESEFDRVLRPFERGDTARGNASGTGLGLSIVDRVARAAGGQVRLSHNLPTGLMVSLYMPLVTTSKTKS